MHHQALAVIIAIIREHQRDSKFLAVKYPVTNVYLIPDSVVSHLSLSRCAAL